MPAAGGAERMGIWRYDGDGAALRDVVERDG
ncbi:hypothetical protein FHR38_005021 [Micromonospora polyrhachis]|uniref:Uncharacterized protein n=1 Tax=Micromonospora polyrhachis TaxID=1282883 RepID=A0A7W7SUN5_9ACTN|nr:hypothetical protein [Micromonospora polyrhachis]